MYCSCVAITCVCHDIMLQMGKTSLVRALMSPTSKCTPIQLDDRTVGIDRYDMQLKASSATVNPFGFQFGFSGGVTSGGAVAKRS